MSKLLARRVSKEGENNCLNSSQNEDKNTQK